MIPAIGLFVSRNWKWLAPVSVVVAFLLAVLFLQGALNRTNEKLDTAVAQRNELATKLTVSNASISDMEKSIAAQNGAIDQLAKDSDARLLEGRALILSEVRKGAKAATVAASLRDKPQTGGDQAATSNAIMANKDLL